jgi:hypothetical protein
MVQKGDGSDNKNRCDEISLTKCIPEFISSPLNLPPASHVFSGYLDFVSGKGSGFIVAYLTSRRVR